MRLFIDHCVPESVAKEFEAAGHEVFRLREKTAPDSPDALVAAVSEANDAVLVTMDNDFKAFAARIGIGQRRYRTLSLIRFDVENLKPPAGSARPCP
jgi:predicted nuclease of predicted toxin-antitoxin system